MPGETESSYRYMGNGHGLAFEVTGPTIESCLARAVEGFTGVFADVHPCVAGRAHQVELVAGSPAGWLRALLEETMRLAAGGELAVTLRHPALDDDVLRANLEAVPLSRARLVGSVPAVLSWHDLTLEPSTAQPGWIGRVVAAL